MEWRWGRGTGDVGGGSVNKQHWLNSRCGKQRVIISPPGGAIMSTTRQQAARGSFSRYSRSFAAFHGGGGAAASQISRLLAPSDEVVPGEAALKMNHLLPLPCRRRGRSFIMWFYSFFGPCALRPSCGAKTRLPATPGGGAREFSSRRHHAGRSFPFVAAATFFEASGRIL